MQELIRELFPDRPEESNKGDFGYVALIGGSLEYSGAIRLAARANHEVECARTTAAARTAGAASVQNSDILPAQTADTVIRQTAVAASVQNGDILPAQTADTVMRRTAVAAAERAAGGNAAMRSGAGVATVAAPGSICHAIIPSILESTIYPLSDRNGELIFKEEEFRKLTGRYAAIAIGMGIGISPETSKAVEYLLKTYDGILIIDADGLNVLSRMMRREPEAAAVRRSGNWSNPELMTMQGSGNRSDSEETGSSAASAYDPQLLRASKAQVVISPHLKEFSRLTGASVEEIQSDPAGHAKAFASDTGTIVLLKGHTTIVTDGETVYPVTGGCAGMATAGSGDVLSGILAAMCACAALRVKSSQKNIVKATATANTVKTAEPVNAGKNSMPEDGTGPVNPANLNRQRRAAVLKAAAGAAYINGLAGELAEKEQHAATMTAGDTAAKVKEAILLSLGISRR